MPRFFSSPDPTHVGASGTGSALFTCTLRLPSKVEYKAELFFSCSRNPACHVLALIYALLGSQAHITRPLLSDTTFSVFLHLHVWVHGAVWPRKMSAQGWQLISHMKGRTGAVSAYGMEARGKLD